MAPSLPFQSLLSRMLLGAGFPTILFVAVALIGMVAIAVLNDSLLWVGHTHEVIEEMMEMRHDAMSEQIAHRNELRMERQVRQQPNLASVLKLFQQEMTTRHLRFHERASALQIKVQENPEQVASIGRVRNLENDWTLAAKAALDRLHQQPLDEMFEKLLDWMFVELSEPSRLLEDEMTEFIAHEQGYLVQRRNDADGLKSQSFWLIVAISTLGLVLALMTIWTTARSVTKPVERLRQAAAELIGGSFEVVSPSGPNEIAELTVHFNHMGLIITERAHSLLEQTERFSQYVGATSHLLWTTNPLGEVVSDLPTWRSFTGQSTEDVLGMGWFQAIHPEERDRIRTSWLSCVESKKPYESECRLRSKDGKYRPFYCRAVPIRNPNGEVREWVGTCTDISDRKRQEILRIEKEAAEASSEAKSEFLAKMSHELRTPLNAIIGMSRMLTTQRFGALNAKQADYMKDIVQAGQHLLNLINDILDLAKVESGKLEIHAEAFQAHAMVGQMISTLRPLAEEKKLVIEQHGPEPDGELFTDPSRFRQVLYNLLSNAIKFTPSGRVDVTTEWIAKAAPQSPVVEIERATAVRISVRDTGVGIPVEEQALVWNEFEQTRSSRVNAIQGTGLGLALTRRLVALLGGSIWLESEPGKGSTFTIVLPRELPKVVEAPIGFHGPAEGQALTLIIEDHAPTRKLLEDWLHDVGMATAWADDGESGLAKARDLKPQLIILDVFLPKLDGWQVLTALKQDPETAHIPVVIASVNEDRSLVGSLDIQEFFVKPIERDTFLLRLRELQPHLFIPNGPIRTLVVDDDPALRKLLGDWLQGERFQVIEAADGNDALARLQEFTPDVIILDLLMPNRDGFDVVDAVRSRPEWAGIPILVVTNKDVTNDERQRLSGRISALITKYKLTPEALRKQLSKLGLVQQQPGSPGTPH